MAHCFNYYADQFNEKSKVRDEAKQDAEDAWKRYQQNETVENLQLHEKLRRRYNVARGAAERARRRLEAYANKKMRKAVDISCDHVYVACEDMNFLWDRDQIGVVREWWRDGASIYEIAARLERDAAEVFVLLIDLNSKRQIPIRKNGVWGECDGLLQQRAISRPYGA